MQTRRHHTRCDDAAHGWLASFARAPENPATAKIPVIVCSVLKEPELALSLALARPKSR